MLSIVTTVMFPKTKLAPQNWCLEDAVSGRPIFSCYVFVLGIQFVTFYPRSLGRSPFQPLISGHVFTHHPKKVKEKLPGKLFLQKPCNRPGPSIMARCMVATHFFIFTPILGEDLSTLINIFQMGWFNHQLVMEFSQKI